MLHRFIAMALLVVCLATPMMTSAQDATPSASAPFDDLVDIGGRKLHLQCTGAGQLTVVLESGLGSDGSAWDSVVPGLADSMRVCVYDRAGLGQSDPAPPGIRTVQNLVDDLHALLAASGEPGPYILAGHSIGGMIVRLFAAQHSTEVAGLVFVDGTPLGWAAASDGLIPDQYADLRDESIRFDTGRDPNNPESFDFYASDGILASTPMASLVPTILLVHDAFEPDIDLPAFLDIPLFDKLFRDMQEVQADTLQGQLVVVPGTGHDIPHERPDAVIDAIQQVVAAVHDPRTWATPAAS